MKNANKIKIDSVFREKLELLCGNHIGVSSKINSDKNISHPPPPPPKNKPIITSQSPSKMLLSQTSENTQCGSCVVNESINTIQTNNIECINCYRSRISYYETRQRLNNKLDIFAEKIIDNCKDLYLENNSTNDNSNKENLNKEKNTNINKYKIELDTMINSNVIYCIMGIFIGIFTVFTSKIIL